MRINGFSGTNTQTGTMGMTQGNDSVSKNIQNQIVNAQQKLQDLSSNEEMSLEDKMKKRQPDLPYFDESFGGEYPEEAPFTISELEEIYPTASAYAKEQDRKSVV